MQSSLPTTSEDDQLLVKPLQILQSKMVFTCSVVGVKVLVQLSNLQPEEATWRTMDFGETSFHTWTPVLEAEDFFHGKRCNNFN